MSPTILRVAHLIAGFYIGGLERMALNLASDREHGVDGAVWAYASEGPFREDIDAAGIPTRAFCREGGGVRPVLPIELAYALRKDRIDVLHTHHIGPFVYGAPAARLAGVAHVHTEHSREYYDEPRWRLVGRMMPHTSTVVCCSEELASWRRDHFGDEPLVILNGVTVPPPVTDEARNEARAKIGVDPDAVVVGAVARICEEKDLGTLLRAFEHAAGARPDAHLVLVGDGGEADEASLDRAIAGSAVAERVHRLGRRSDVAELLPGFDIIGLSSLREGLPLALLEGMAHGLPAVSTAVGEIPALLGGGGGLTAPVRDHVALGAALSRYLADPERRHADGAAARALVQEHYSASAMCSAYADAYRATLG